MSGRGLNLWLLLLLSVLVLHLQRHTVFERELRSANEEAAGRHVKNLLASWRSNLFEPLSSKTWEEALHSALHNNTNGAVGEKDTGPLGAAIGNVLTYLQEPTWAQFLSLKSVDGKAVVALSKRQADRVNKELGIQWDHPGASLGAAYALWANSCRPNAVSDTLLAVTNVDPYRLSAIAPKTLQVTRARANTLPIESTQLRAVSLCGFAQKANSCGVSLNPMLEHWMKEGTELEYAEVSFIGIVSGSTNAGPIIISLVRAPGREEHWWPHEMFFAQQMHFATCL